MPTLTREQVSEIIDAALEKGTKPSLKHTDLSDIDLCDIDLSRTNLSGANLSGARLAWAHLSRDDQRKSVLHWVDLHGVRYNDATIWPEDVNPKAAGAIEVQ